MLIKHCSTFSWGNKNYNFQIHKSFNFFLKSQLDIICEYKKNFHISIF